MGVHGITLGEEDMKFSGESGRCEEALDALRSRT